MEFELEYGKATIEIHKDAVNKNEKIIIIDDLIATGGTAEAGAKLVEKSNGQVSGFVFVMVFSMIFSLDKSLISPKP